MLMGVYTVPEVRYTKAPGLSRGEGVEALVLPSKGAGSAQIRSTVLQNVIDNT